jgi:hypothetical protein
MTTSIDAYFLQPVKHRTGLEAVAEGFAAAPLSMPIDVHDLFRKYLQASDTLVVPRIVFLQMSYDLQRAWEATGRDVSPKSHGEFYKTFLDVVSRIASMPGPFPDVEGKRTADIFGTRPSEG